MKKMKLSQSLGVRLCQLFRDYRSVHDALMNALDDICRKAITEYNSDKRNHVKIKRHQIHTSRWYPDQKTTSVGIRIWVNGRWPKMSSKKAAKIDETFRKVLNKHLPRQEILEIRSYVQNIIIENEND